MNTNYNISWTDTISHEEYTQNIKNDALQHFYDKLLIVHRYIKTPHAIILAEDRTNVLKCFINGFLLENVNRTGF